MEKNKQTQKIIELKTLEQQINQLQQQLSLCNNQISEFKKLKENLGNIKDFKKDTEMFSSLGAGIFIKTEVKETQKVIMNVGANTFVSKSIIEANKLIEKQITELIDVSKQMELNLQGAAMKAQQLQQEITTLTAKTK